MKSLRADVATKHTLSITFTPTLFKRGRRLERIPSSKTFCTLKDKILGKRYGLSLVFCNNTLSRKLNRLYRNKDKPTNILSFPLSPSMGEIFINLQTAGKELREFEMNHEKFLTYLFIHGCLHLKGKEHGRTMRQQELKLLNVSTNNYRYRYR